MLPENEINTEGLEVEFNDHTSFSPNLKNGYTNHLPMAVHAMLNLGASEEQLDEFKARYADKLDPLVSDNYPQIDTDSWEIALGDPEAYQSFARFFESEISEHGREHVLNSYVSDLLPGLSSEAFHAVIRLSYATRVGSDAEIAHALAYWASRYVDHRWPAENSEPVSGLDKLIDQIAAEENLPDEPLEAGPITSKMIASTNFPGYDNISLHSALQEVTLEELEAFALSAFAATRSFTMLHGVTGTFALRTLENHLEDKEALRDFVGQALVIAYISIGKPDVAEAELENTELEWDEIKQLAIESYDEHVIKLADVCLLMHQQTGNELYREVASDISSRGIWV